MIAELCARMFPNDQVQINTDGTNDNLMTLLQMIIVTLSMKRKISPKAFLEDLLQGAPDEIQKIESGFESKGSDFLDKYIRNVVRNIPPCPERPENN